MRLVNMLFIGTVSLAGGCSGSAMKVDREILLVGEIEYDEWQTRRQFPYEFRYPAVTASYVTAEPDELIRFHCGPIGHIVRHVKLDGTNVEELSQIRLQTGSGKKMCNTITGHLHELAEHADGERPLARLLLKDRHKSGTPHVRSLRYKGRVVDFN